MSNTLKNLLIVLAVVTIGYAGYYLYTSRSSTASGSSVTDAEYQSMLNRTQAFMQHSQELNSLKLDMSILENEAFITLQSNTSPLVEVEAGRENPFATTGN